MFFYLPVQGQEAAGLVAQPVWLTRTGLGNENLVLQKSVMCFDLPGFHQGVGTEALGVDVASQAVPVKESKEKEL